MCYGNPCGTEMTFPYIGDCSQQPLMIGDPLLPPLTATNIDLNFMNVQVVCNLIEERANLLSKTVKCVCCGRSSLGDIETSRLNYLNSLLKPLFEKLGITPYGQ
jgi:hypothetical protein